MTLFLGFSCIVGQLVMSKIIWKNKVTSFCALLSDQILLETCKVTILLEVVQGLLVRGRGKHALKLI